MTDCEYLRNIILTTLYGIFITLELICTSFLIDNIDSIKNVLKNDTFQMECKSDRINTFDDGVLYENTFAFVIMISIMIGMIIINIFNHKKKSIGYDLKNYNEESKPLLNIIKIDKIELCFNIILIMSIIGFIILNVTQLIFQLYNVSINCIELIDDSVSGFLLVYSLLECCCTLLIISLFFLYAFFK